MIPRIRVANSRPVACVALVVSALFVPGRAGVLLAQRLQPEGTAKPRGDVVGVNPLPVLGTLSPIGVVHTRGSSTPLMKRGAGRTSSDSASVQLYNADDYADLRIDGWRAARVTGEVVGVVAVLFAIFVVSRVRAD